MKEITNAVTVKAMMRKKQELEVMLAWELLEIFNNPEMKLLGQLHEMVRRSIGYMDKVSKGEPLDKEEEKGMGMEKYEKRYKSIFNNRKKDFDEKWKKDWSQNYFKFPELGGLKGGMKQPPGIKPIWNAGEISANVDKFNAQHCADWIRVFGEVLEKVVKGKADKIRKSWQKGDRPGKPYHWDTDRKSWQKGDGKPYHWEKYDSREPGPQLETGRRRVKGPYRTNEVVMPDYEPQERLDRALYFQDRNQQLGNKIGPVISYPAPSLSVWGFQRDITGAAGLNRWQVMQRDTTGKMDQVFGLMPGATISGTTTDNIDFLKRFGGLGLHPIFYTLPLATIVAGGHHSMIEVAVPLMLNKINDYRVGLFSTLFPVMHQTISGAPPGVSAIKNKLIIAENHKFNELILIHYDSYGKRTPAGCYVYDSPKDKLVWGNMRIGEEFMLAFKSLRPFPTKMQLKYLMGQLGL